MIGPIVFWAGVGGLLYVYAVYPMTIILLARWFPRPVEKGRLAAKVSVLVAAHNEEQTIAQKIRNVLSLNQADQICQVLVGSDGSSDRTVEEARSVSDPRVVVLEFAQRRGKAAVLNDLMTKCAGDIVLMTDARQQIEVNALDALLSNFADPRVGVVSGELIFRTASGAAAGMATYWDYEKAIRKAEARFHSVPGATGALYAIRRELLKPIPAETLLDDVVIPMRAVVSGYRCIFEPNAIVWDTPTADEAREAVRKRRTFAGNLQLFKLHPEWLLPNQNPIAWQYVSHKLARLFTPFFLLAMLAGAGLSWPLPFYAVALVLQLALLLIGCFAGHQKTRQKLPLVLRLVGAFLLMQTAMLGAWWDAIRGRFIPTWQRGVNP